MRLFLLPLALVVGCDEPAPPPAPPQAPAAPEPAPKPEAPEASELPQPGSGRASVAFPVWGDHHYDFPVEDLEAGFGIGERITLIKVGPAEPDANEHSITLTFRGALEVGAHRVEREGTTDVFTAGLEGTPLRARAGEVVIDREDDDAIVGTFDLEVLSPLNPEVTPLRGRFEAKREAFYDGQLQRARVIQNRNRRR